MRIRPGHALLLAAALGAGLGTPACKGRSSITTSAPGSEASAHAELPPLVLREDTPSLLLTWVDAEGNFHVVEHVAEVPEASRDAVRVVVADRADGTGDLLYVADLRQKRGDGTYAVGTTPRAEWDERGASKRTARLEAIQPPPSASAAEAAPGPAGSGAAPGAEVRATIYGASWCGPCHQAEALLKSLGVKVVKKDIEESDVARREMEAALRRVHRSGGSIPVIDVMGQVFVGFSAGPLRAAVARARAGSTL